LLPLVCAGLVLTACTNDSSGGEQSGPPLPESSASATPTPSQSLDAKAQTIITAAKKAGITVTGLPKDPQQRELALIAVRYNTATTIANGPDPVPDKDLAAVLESRFLGYMINNLRLEENQGISRRGLNFGEIKATGSTAIVNFCGDYTQFNTYSTKGGRETLATSGGVNSYSYPMKKINNSWKINDTKVGKNEDDCTFG
jgi:hypothetical protein